MSEKNFFNGKTAWITGASSGIGEATAKRLAGLNVRVIISSNDIPELNRVEKEIKEPSIEYKNVYSILAKYNKVRILAD